MSPSFDDLVGSDLEPGERERLERVHELLVAAGPPPEFEPQARVVAFPRRRRGALVAIAAALAVAVLAFGGALVRDGGPFVISMSGTTAAPTASASLHVFELDDAGNWPMEVSVEGLQSAPSGRPFELWLTRDGERESLCGSFLTDTSGAAVVPMNAPYRFNEYDGWVVVEEGSDTPLLTT
jgi:hypothetical protein